MIRLFKKVYDSHVAENIAQLSFIKNTNKLEIYTGQCASCRVLCAENGESVLYAGGRLVHYRNRKWESTSFSVCENRLVGLCIPDAGQVHLVPS